MMLKAPAPKAPAPVLAPADVAPFVARIRAAIADLTGLLVQETDLVARLRMKDAGSLVERKTAASALYRDLHQTFAANAPLIRQHGGPAIAALKAEHQALQVATEKNLVVLATTHAVAEDLIRGAAEAARVRRAPQTYGASGQTGRGDTRSPGPLVVSRAL
jgi:hypothetical protein